MSEDDPKVRIGKLVERARSRAGFSQEALAAKMQAVGLPISASKLEEIESGRCIPNTESATVLESLLGIDLGEFELPQPKTHVPIEIPGRGSPADVLPRPASRASSPPSSASGEGLPARLGVPERDRKARIGGYPRVTLYLAPETKALLDATSSILRVPAYQLLTTAFLEHFRALPDADRELIDRVAQQRGKRAKPMAGSAC